MLGVNMPNFQADPRPTPAPAAEPRWTVLTSPAALEPWAAAIDELVEREQLPALATWAWHSAFWEGFFHDDKGVEMHLCHRGNRMVAALPVRRTGRLLRTLRTVENEHFVYWTAPADSQDPRLGSLLLDHLLDGVESLELRRLLLDGPLAVVLRQEASRRGLPVVEHENAEGEVSVPLVAPFAEFEKTVSKNLRRDSRLVTKLEALGKVEYQLVEAPDAVDRELPACLELEARGWKGAAGSPILADGRTHRFYRALAERAARAGRMRLYLLKLDGRLIAYEYDLCAGGRVECLKIGYDESLSRFSPGTILRMMILRQVIERGEATAYHLGRISSWKRRWVKQTDRIGTLRIFAGSKRGRLAHLGGPVLRGTIKQLPGVKPLLQRAKAMLNGRNPEPAPSADKPESST